MKNLSEEFKKDIFRYVKFVFGGGIGLLIGLVATYLLTEFLFLWHMTSFAIVIASQIFFLFVYHSRVTFRKRGKFLLFALIVLFISALNWVLVYILTVLYTMPYLIAIVLAVALVSVLNYFLNKKFVF